MMPTGPELKLAVVDDIEQDRSQIVEQTGDIHSARCMCSTMVRLYDRRNTKRMGIIS